MIGKKNSTRPKGNNAYLAWVVNQNLKCHTKNEREVQY